MERVSVYEFGPFRLEIAERRLLRGKEPVALRAKVFDTLSVLVQNAGRLMTKDELLRAIWPDTVVEENNLNHTISVLRKALTRHVTDQEYVETVPRVGYRFAAKVVPIGTAKNGPAAAPPSAPRSASVRQEIRFCRAPDGVRIAYSKVGAGPPLVKAANWMNHLEFEWDSPIWKHWVELLYPRHTLIRFDERGNGLSDWNTKDLSHAKWVTDLEAVIEASQIDKFPLLGISQGGSVAIEYAVRHPERVTHLVLYGAFARGWKKRGDPEDMERREAAITLARYGWGTEDPAFRQCWTTHFIPDGKPEHWAWFNELQKVTTSPENAAVLLRESGEIEVTHLLNKVKVPTIVFHCEQENVVPFQEGRILASGIAGARLVPLPSKNHLILEEEPAWGIFAEELGRFLGWK